MTNAVGPVLVQQKWRPPLGLITAALIAVALALPGAGFLLSSPAPMVGVDYLVARPMQTFWVAVLTLSVVAVFGFVFLRTITRPIAQLVTRTEAIARGDRTALKPLPHHGTREFAGLTQSFLTMSESLFDRSDYLATFVAHRA